MTTRRPRMRWSDLHPLPSGHRSTVLYRFYDVDGVLLYVGITNDFPRRYTDHQRTQPWWPEVADWTVSAGHRNRSDAEDAERQAITTERPRYNIVHNRPTARARHVAGRLVDGSRWAVHFDGPYAHVCVDRTFRAHPEHTAMADALWDPGRAAVRAAGYRGDVHGGCGPLVWSIPTVTGTEGAVIAWLDHLAATPENELARRHFHPGDLSTPLPAELRYPEERAA